MIRRMLPALAGAALAAAVVTPAHATDAAVEGSAAVCGMYPGSVLANGAHSSSGITVGYPPVSIGFPGVTPNVFSPGAVRLSTTFTSDPHSAGAGNEGWVVQGDSLYYRSYWIDSMSQIDSGQPNDTQRVGGGWANFTALETSQYYASGAARNTAYGLRSDGTLFRWSVDKWFWKATGSAPGFASVKSMALISKTATYDTFLANTRGGALYTIQLPVKAPMKPIVKPVRTKTWQGFEKLIANKCGQYGTILLAIDKESKAGYLYAVGHANGAATVINGLGKVQTSFNDPVYFRWGALPYLDPLNGG
ncbi:hypothetical protein AB0L70_03230 [Kribbella sp. NPDC051952]|uniref:hypothetical protein n=1 Tax=Kribbella sp. NPDC051952 TaxID=3154851 RepID=UPI00343636EB